MTTKPALQIRIGISGWTYPPWRGVFYPKDLPHARELAYASRMLNSIEINGTFYSLQRPSSFQAWYEATPDNFVFAIKASRYITHMLKLRNVEVPLANFLASGLLALKHKLGPILWQFPPMLKFDAERLDSFLRLVPRDTASAADLAKEHDERLKGRAWITTDVLRPLRHAIEIRNESFDHPEFIDVLRRHQVALVFADTAGKWRCSEDLTSDFVYARLHGDEELYVSGYSPEALDRWASRLSTWAGGQEPADAIHWSGKKPAKTKSRDVYAYFDNDVKVKSPFDAISLAHRLGETALGESQSGNQPPVTPRLTKKALAERVQSHWPTRSRRP